MTESRFDQSTYFLKIFLKTKGPPTSVAKLCFWLNLALWESFGSLSRVTRMFYQLRERHCCLLF